MQLFFILIVIAVCQSLSFSNIRAIRKRLHKFAKKSISISEINHESFRLSATIQNDVELSSKNWQFLDAVYLITTYQQVSTHYYL